MIFFSRYSFVILGFLFSIDSIYSDIQKLIIEKKKYSQKAVNSAIVPSVSNLSSIVTNNSSSMSTKTMDTLSLNEIKFVSF